jgi:MOSC domain-containing protein YiiM
MKLAQLNIARIAYPLDSKEMQDFTLALNAINLLAEQSPGFVWLLKDENNTATTFRIYDDPSLIVNMSVWESLEDLRHYVFNSGHSYYLKRRKEWFIPLAQTGTVLWWIKDNHIPNLIEAQEKLDLLRLKGSTQDAFGFAQAFPAPASVLAVSRSATHTMSKHGVESLQILKGLGVENDAHQGVTVKHRSRVARDPNQPNLRQVHLIHAELFKEVAAQGFTVLPGQMGENITTSGIDLLKLPKGTILEIGSVQLEVTGLRNPCSQIDGLQNGLLKEVLETDADGNLIRKAGIMTIVLEGGEVRPDDNIKVILPPEPHQSLEVV